MVRSVSEEYFVKYYTSEVTGIGATEETGPDFFVTTMTKFLSNSYDDLEETLTHMKSLKLKINPGENVSDFCAEILVDAERLKIAGTFKPEHLGYITRIFENTSDYIFRL